MSLTLRPHQSALVDKLTEAIKAGHRCIMVCAPCAFGKTEFSTAMLLRTYEKGFKGCFVADRIALINQTSERFDRYGLPHGVEQATHERRNPEEPIQLCSIQTVIRRQWPEADVYWHDEAHCLSEAQKKRMATDGKLHIGLSATPVTRGLGKHFSKVITADTTARLISEGWLTPYRVFAPKAPDMTGARVQNGEWVESDTEERVLPIVGDCVEEYKKHGSGKKFIAFATSVRHAEAIAGQFMQAGILARPYHYKTSDNEREELIQEFKKPDSIIRGLISIESLTRGFDVTDIEVLIMARPLRKSLATVLQMIGRVLRTAEGKQMATILDLAGNFMRFYDDIEEYMHNGVTELDDGTKKPQEKPDKDSPEKGKCCPRCHHVHPIRPSCPNCGHVYPIPKPEEHVKGELVEFKGIGKAPLSSEQQWYSGLLHHANRRGYKEGYAFHQFLKKWKKKPDHLHKHPKYNEEVERWLFSREIAYRMATQKHRKVS